MRRRFAPFAFGLLAALGFAAPAAPAQQPPAAAPAGPDIWLAPVARAVGEPRIGPARNLTRRAGYDNQPRFLPDGSGLLYVAEDSGQTDVFRFDFRGMRITRLTRTPEWREYSPSLSANGDTLLVVRWDRPVARGAVWRYNQFGTPVAELRGSVAQVGYYARLDAQTYAYFVNDSVRSFVIGNTRTGRVDTVARGIGGSAPQRIPGTAAASVLTRDSAGAWWITRFEPSTRRMTPLVRAVPGSTQYTWTPAGTVWMARGATLYEWDRRRGRDFRPVHTFAEAGARTVTRLALSPRGDRLAFVAEPTTSAATLLRQGIEAGDLGAALAAVRARFIADRTSLDPGGLGEVADELARTGRADDAARVRSLAAEITPRPAGTAP